jgi:Fe-S-cluster-containing hydrogenase component 2
MGHLGPKELYLKLGDTIDGLGTRVPRNETLNKILKELYTPEEARVVSSMPYGLASLDRIADITGLEHVRLQKTLEALAQKGLIIDIWANDEYHYMPSPMVIGIFEFTMMRTRGQLEYKKWAGMFNEYLTGDFFEKNYGDGQVISLMRSIPHEGSIEENEYTEILDYEKAASIIHDHDTFAIGICSCRHKKKHAGIKECDMPLNTCSTFGYAADYWIRNKLAKKVSRTEMLENIARSRELGLAFCGDNVKNNVTFICHCCKCCCVALSGISKYGYANAVVTSNYIARCHDEKCTGCGKCAKACPIDVIEMRPIQKPGSKRRMEPVIDTAYCLGCGVCSVKCPKGAMKLTHRKSRVLHPETVFEKVILGNLERGTLQNQIFDNPESVTQKFMRGFVGGFLRLPVVKRNLMSEKLRSRFLDAMKKGVALQGKDWVLKL